MSRPFSLGKKSIMFVAFDNSQRCVLASRKTRRFFFVKTHVAEWKWWKIMSTGLLIVTRECEVQLREADQPKNKVALGIIIKKHLADVSCQVCRLWKKQKWSCRTSFTDFSTTAHLAIYWASTEVFMIESKSTRKILITSLLLTVKKSVDNNFSRSKCFLQLQIKTFYLEK